MRRSLGFVFFLPLLLTAGWVSGAAATLPLLRWNLLRLTVYDPRTGITWPDSVRAFDGKMVRIEGYIMVRFGSQDSGDLLVSALHPVSLFCGPTDMTAVVETYIDGFDPGGKWPDLPVEVTGSFHLSRNPTNHQAIYRLYATSWRRLHTWEQDFPGVVDEVLGGEDTRP